MSASLPLSTRLLSLLFIGFAAQFLASSLNVQAETAPQKEWTVKYDNGGVDGGMASTADADGNSYITGSSQNGTSTDNDFATVKYDTYGNQMWVARYTGGIQAGARAIALDISGNVYVTGYDSGVVTVKYNSAGNQLWVVRYNQADVGRDIGVDKFGNIYVLAIDTGYKKHHIIKYGPDGNMLWSVSFGDKLAMEGVFTTRQTHSMVLDAGGNVHAVANTFNGVTYDYITVEYDFYGNKTWESEYDSGGTDFGRTIAVDSIGNTFVTGYSAHTDSIESNFATVKYNQNGQQLWVANYGTNGRAVDVSVDKDGNAYVLGTGADAGPLILIKYSTSGAQLWTRVNESYGVPRSISIDKDSYIFVLNANSIVKYSSSGGEQWSIPNTSVDVISSFALDSLEDIYIGGYSYLAGVYDYEVTKFTNSSQPNTFLSPIKNPTQNYLNLRKTPGSVGKPADDIIKTLPNDWVVKVLSTTDASSMNIDLDGYRWYQVLDITDNARGWVTGKSLTSSTVYLNYDQLAQASLEGKATTTPYLTKAARIPVILQAVDIYYAQSSLSKSLYDGSGGLDGLNNFQRFIQSSNYPKELFLAIAGHESAGTLDNEICSGSRDGGIGIMQITSEGFKGLGSGLKNYPKVGDCRSSSVPTSSYYSNAFQGIFASIKDGMRTLQAKYKSECPNATIVAGGLIYSCQDIERVLMTWKYNGKVLTGNYLGQISTALANLSLYFPGLTYANNDQLIEKLRVANANRIEFKKFSPVEIQVMDSQGRTTGFDGTPVIKDDIPFSDYDTEADGGVIFFPQDTYTYKVIGTGTGTYAFNIEYTKDDILHTFHALNIPVVTNEVYTYKVDWDALDRGERGVTIGTDVNGDGLNESTTTAGKETSDVELPQIILNTPLTAEYLLDSPLQLSFSATDTISGIATITATLNGIPVQSGQTLMLTKSGVNTLVVTSTDNSGNITTLNKTFRVSYVVNGFLSPLASRDVYQKNATIPVKFQLKDIQGKYVSGVAARLYIAKITQGVVGADVPAISTSKANIGNYFREDNHTYILDLSTKKMSEGTWQIKAVLDSGQEITERVVIQ